MQSKYLIIVWYDSDSQIEHSRQTFEAETDEQAVAHLNELELPQSNMLCLLFKHDAGRNVIIRFRYHQFRLLTCMEAASRMGVSIQTLRRYMRMGILTADFTKAGNHFFNPKTIDKFSSEIKPTIVRGNPKLQNRK